MAQCEHQDDEGQLCTSPAKYDVSDRYHREWMACAEHARECEREGCEVGWDEEEK